MPKTLQDWTVAHVESLVALGTSEDQDFDFKGAAVLTDAGGAASLSKEVAAFANSRGGFIVIGVRDKPRVIEGVRVDAELAKRIHDRVKVYPMPSYPGPRALPWKDGLSIVILEVPASSEGPHASVADKMPQFYVRTHAGAEPMNWVAIRDAMLRADERRRNVDILLGELEQHNETARIHRNAPRVQREPFPVTRSFELTLTRMALAALYPWISRDPHLGPDMSRLMGRMDSINGQIQAMITEVAYNPNSLEKWRGRMAVVCSGFRDPVVQVDTGIRRVFELPALEPHHNRYPEH